MVKVNKLATIRIQGQVDIREGVNDTLEMLNLNRPNQCVIVRDEPSFRGMLKKAKEIVTWGPIEPEVLEKLLLKRGEFEGGGEVTDEKVDSKTPYSSVEELAEAVCENDFDLKDFEGLEKVFRLHPPKKGFDFTGRSVGHGGAKGDRGEKINDLILRML